MIVSIPEVEKEENNVCSSNKKRSKCFHQNTNKIFLFHQFF